MFKLSAKRYKSKTTMYGNDFNYVAIHCPMPPYELVWHIFREAHIQFQCEPNLFLPKHNQDQSQHILYFFKGNQSLPRTWLLQNQGSQGVLIQSKPLPDYCMVWENNTEFSPTDFWISLLKDKGLVQMAYLYPQERSTKITWCFDLPQLLSN